MTKKNIHGSCKELFEGILKAARDAGELVELDKVLEVEKLDGWNNIPLTDCDFNVNCTLSTDNLGNAFICISILFAEDTRPHEIGFLCVGNKDLDTLKIMGKAVGALVFYADKHRKEHWRRYTAEGEPVGTTSNLTKESEE